MPISNFSANSGFSFSVGMIETRLALPQRSPSPLSVPWIWRAPARTAASEFATACSVSLWAWMPTWSPGMTFTTSRDDRFDLVRQRAAVGVAEHHPARALARRRPWRRRARIADWPCSRRRNARSRAAPRGPWPWRRHAVADRGEVLLLGGLERDPHVIVPGLGDEADGVGLGVEQRRQPRIVRGRAAGPPRHAEGREGRVELALLGEQLGVGRIGARIAALDVVDAEIVEHLGDRELVAEREIDAVGLRAVAQRGVEEIEPFAGHCGHQRR